MSERKHYLDNIRWITVCIVVIYHIIYIFNCSGVITNMNVKGIPIMDTFLIFVYPWFMCLLFVVAGISARYSLSKRNAKQFLKERTKKILVPSIVGIFAYGWICGVVTSQYTDMFGEASAMIPSGIKYLIYCLTGTGPLWFAHVIFIASVLLVLIRKIDKNDKFYNLCKKVNIGILLIITLLVWGSAQILNAPLITVYRFGIYLFMFFIGYFVFSHDEVIEKVEKISVPMSIIALILGICYTIYYYGSNFTENSCLNSIFTNVYLWIMIIAILGISKKYLNFTNKFTCYMNKNNFSFYVLHYIIVLVTGHLLVTYVKLPFAIYYVLILLITTIVLPIIVEILKRIPILNKLILGVYKKEG